MNPVFRHLCLALLLAAASSAAAQQETLPDLPALLERVKANQHRIQQMRRDFICREVDDVDKIDDIDGVTKHMVEEYEFTWRGTVPVRRLQVRNGVPLAKEELARQEEQLEKQLHKEEKKLARANSSEDWVEIFLRASLFSNPMRETYHGRKVISVSIHPNPSFTPHTETETIVHTLGGTLWIDEEDAQVARLEAKLDENFHVGGGLAASFNKNSGALIEQQRIDDEIWLPSLNDINLEGRKMIYLAGIHEHVTQHFYNYHRFRAESKLIFDLPEDNANKPADPQAGSSTAPQK
jgi:hypothetical protein